MKTLYSGSSDQGNRPSQQDAFLEIENIFGDNNSHLFVVLDGHGTEGGNVAEFVRANIRPIFSEFKKHSADESKQNEFLKKSFTTLSRKLADSGIDIYMSGTTLVMAIIWEDNMCICNVGDSKAYLVSNSEGTANKTEQMSVDHICNNEEERKRIITAGGRIEKLVVAGVEPDDGPLRIFKGSLPYPGLVVSRSLGDCVLDNYGVISEPSICHVKLQKKHKFLILCTDGVSDGLSIDELNDIVTKFGKDVHILTKRITEKSLRGLDAKEIDDNTTNICIKFEF